MVGGLKVVSRKVKGRTLLFQVQHCGPSGVRILVFTKVLVQCWAPVFDPLINVEGPPSTHSSVMCKQVPPYLDPVVQRET